jgi:hypothetical protein
MRFHFHILAALVLFLTEAAYSQTNLARIFRLTFSERRVSDRANLYCTHTNLNSRKAILRYLTKGSARLTERDVVIMQIADHGERAEPVTRFRWSLASACITSGAALYDFDCSGVVTNRDSGIREMSVLHWKSSYETPDRLPETEFYFDEEFTGIGETGLKETLRRMSTRKPRFLGLAGSRYTLNSSYSPWETPFEKIGSSVYACLKTNGITQVHLCADYVWAAPGEDFYDRKTPKKE